ncbi:MAG: diaminobutyrate acetyltransferase [Planctomycetaceae bacterium]|nr:diaminobutyrate acetyltransferase [Planctomycetaceae bacterium]
MTTPGTINPETTNDVCIRPATLEDAASVWRLVRDSGMLDLNSVYLYLLLCRDFSATCLVAERGGRLVGFVTAYHPPARPQVLFVWQIGIEPGSRRQGLGHQLLMELICQSRRQKAIEYIEATVTASNTASRRLFANLADRLAVPLLELPGFTAAHFRSAGEDDQAGCSHEAEPVLRLGPLQPSVNLSL